MPEIIRKVDLVDISGRSFINYAMSVIVDRALPDVRDGLKPVHRRILYALDELGFVVEKPHKKSVTTVGHVLGRYHPHGDSSAYNAMVTLIQPFTSRYPLVDGHGNFGSTDGDSPAAMRYTEARFSRIGQAMTENIHKDTIDFIPNFDNNHKEPKVLPTLIPNLLANGTTGIAVGMATNLAPHNLTELYDALDYIILQTLEGEEVDEMKIMDYVKAPDFPTGGQIVGLEGVKKAFLTGNGKIIVRGKYSVIEESGKTSIVITEIPYRVNKARLVEKIDSLMKTGIINGIRELRDDSDKEGTSIFIELKRDAQPQLIINKLLKHTELQTTFNVNNTVLVETSNGSLRPQVVSLKEALMHFLTHAATVIIRRSAYDCQRATERLNLVRGQLLALDHLDEVIAIIRGSEDPVAELLNSEYGFNKEQAEAVVEMRLKALTNASLTKLTTEATTLEDSIQYLTSIVEDDAVLLNTMRKEFETLKKKFGDERRTEIVLDDSEIEESDLVEDEMLIVTYSSDGLLKAVEEKEYRTQNRGTKGSKGITTKDDEIIKYLLTVNSKEDLLFFTNQGRCHMLKAYNIGKTSRTARGKSINNYLKLMPNEFVITMISTDSKNKDNHLLFVTHNGIIKRLALENLSTRHSVTKVVEFKEGDSLVSVAIIDDSSQVLLTTALGQAVRISMSPDVSKSVRAMGRAAAGVIGIKLKSKDYVVDMAVVQDDSTILTVTENGLGKRTKLSEYQVQARGGSGILTHKLGPKTGPIVAALVVNDSDELFIATNQGLVVRIDVDSISTLSRNTAGVKVINLNEGDKVASVSKGNEEDIETETASEVS